MNSPSDRQPGSAKPKDLKKQEVDRNRMRAMRIAALVTQLPFTIVAGYGLGYGLDYLFGTDFLRVVFLLLGAIGGFTQLIREVLKDARNEQRE